MDTKAFDQAVIAAVFQRAALVGWGETTLLDAARDAGIADLARLRIRFPSKAALLLRFGTAMDQHALTAVPSGTPREKLFDLVMGRFDQMQQHRSGVLALLAALRTDPATAAMLALATLTSMRWMLDGAGIPSTGIVGMLRIQGLGAVWAYCMRAWERDEGADLPATMAALDRALDRAMQAEASLPGRQPVAPNPPVTTLAGADVAASEHGAAVL